MTPVAEVSGIAVTSVERTLADCLRIMPVTSSVPIVDAALPDGSRINIVYSDDDMRGYGKTVILDHGDGVTTLYAHNSELLVRQGQHVRPGEHIARIGRTGNASTEHCHFEIRRDEAPLDPLRFLVPEVEARR